MAHIKQAKWGRYSMHIYQNIIYIIQYNIKLDINGVNLKMHVKKRYDENSDIAEIEIHDINTKDIYKPSPKILDIHQPKHRKLLKAIPSDIHILLPIREGNDFIVMRLGWTTLQKTNLDSNDVEGRMYVMFFHFIIIY